MLRQQQLQQDVAGQLLDSVEPLAAAAGADWAAVAVSWSEVDARNEMWMHVRDAAGSDLDVGPLPTPQSLPELREAMADPERGAWWSTDVVVRRDGTFSFAFNYDDRVYWSSEPDAPYALPTFEEIEPTAQAFARDLERYPRRPDLLPAWLIEGVAAEAPARPAAAGLDVDAAFVLAGTDAPAPLVPYLPRAGWPELWAEVRRASEDTVRSAVRDAQLDLAQPRRAVLDDTIELVQFVLDDVIARALDPQTVAQLRALAGAPAVDDATGALPVAGNHDLPAVAEVLPGLVELLDRASVDYLSAVIAAAPDSSEPRA